METVVLDGFDGWSSPDVPSLVIDSIFDDAEFKELLWLDIKNRDVPVSSYGEVLTYLRLFFRDNVGWQDAILRHDVAAQVAALADYEKEVDEGMATFEAAGKPNPDALFWPNPLRDPASSLYETLPFVDNTPLISKETPVGSAGSCFAFEIAYELQSRGFNYVSKEQEHKPDEGVLISDRDPNVTFARFPANWGQLFNSPSFRQLAEKAFGVRPLPRLLHKTKTPIHGDTVFGDPFREGIWFSSPEAFEVDYDRHVAAAREALLACRVFIITLGLNECWQFIPDGSFLARNPRNRLLQSMLRSRIRTVEENVADIQRFIDVVRAHNADFTLLISVSPVPLAATVQGHDQHVISANGHSKAVLRVAAEELVKANRDVHYFPSYEMVTMCTAAPWAEDQRHVSRPAVAGVMSLFDAMFAA